MIDALTESEVAEFDDFSKSMRDEEGLWDIVVQAAQPVYNSADLTNMVIGGL